jgi:allantoin racemase
MPHEPMMINVINPNTTVSMTTTIERAAVLAARESTTIRCVSSQHGPESIEGYYDEALSMVGVLAEIEAGDSAGASAHVIACFDDTGLDAARCISDHPVVGIGEAACHVASMLGCSFSIVTTLQRSIPALRRNVVHYGFGERCVSIRAAEVEVLALDDGDSFALGKINEQIGIALDDDGAEAIVLGCAGMTDLAGSLSDEHGVPVIDGVGAAVVLAEGLVSLGLGTSKVCGYATPLPKRRT